VRDIVPELSCPITSYGFSEDAQVRAVNVRAEGAQMRFTVQRRNGVTLPDLEVVLNLAGEHNVLNALSAIAVAVELNIPDEAVLRALASFKGVGRRFQRYGDLPAKDGGQFTVIDDYGHHPVEMAATLAAARGAFPGRRWCWPSSRTATRARATALKTSCKVIGSADAVLLTEVYAAGEAPVVAADGRALARALRVAGGGAPVCGGHGRSAPGHRRQCRRTATWCCAWVQAPLVRCHAGKYWLLQNTELKRQEEKAQ
jgi:UDP-N-acetylmuramate--alanine ligase